ncbi:hypothetical protein GCM10011576_63920 [Micromonospora parathelypteridis]|nr:hypothetical protein GCM10011576_63920 [Micromonospora parathelypteridis]
MWSPATPGTAASRSTKPVMNPDLPSPGRPRNFLSARGRPDKPAENGRQARGGNAERD